MKFRPQIILAPLILAGAVIVAFGGCVYAAFTFDDFALFSNDSPVALPQRAIDCFRLTQTRPLTELSFWLNDALFGRVPIPWHSVGVLLHLAIVLLVWDMLRQLIGERGAFISAAIFAVHPFMTEPVAYVFARGTLLAALFSLLAIRSWIGGRFWLAVLWFTVAMLAKEECVAVPILLILLPKPRNWKAFAAMIAIAVTLGLRVLWATKVVAGSQSGFNAGISPLAYLFAQGVAILRYLRLLVIPWGFSIDPSMHRPAMWIAILSWTAIIAICFVIPQRARFWFLMGLLLLAPSSSILPAADLAADRRMYLPMIAFCACAGLLLEKLNRLAILAAICILIAISIRYSLLWQNPEAIWREAKRLAPDAIRPRIQLVRALPLDRALDELQAIPSNDPAIATEQGRVLLQLGRPADALAAFGKALAATPSDARAISNRATALAALGSIAAAKSEFVRALRVDPCLQDARENLRKLGVESATPRQCSSF